MECASARLVAGELLLISDASDSKRAIDVQEILLSSQLYADFKCVGSNKFTSPKEWRKYYADALLHARWTIIDDQDYKTQPQDTAALSLEAMIEDYLLKQLAAVEADAFRQLFKHMAGLAETDPITLQLYQHGLKTSDDDGGASTFSLQFSVFDAPTQMVSLFLTFTTTETVGSTPLSQAFAGRHIVGDIEAFVSRRTWNAGNYEAIRKSIRDFLNGRQTSLILPIPCEVPDDIDQA
ncbi:hypothetical protein ASF84_16535 [Pseudomonas sp. Leaf127]|uniref:hypothetical protein n=1 Tax=Pseudomonas sp. Leaf127 TaxID=1736267 RepID=UPI0007026DE2|nr:hypothetical protein [Pseudomonas sp. Leaf127]KQQ54919.1 hypothetical protein ASF84_16535 [Pseudomonas sp. Leaf127]